MELFFFNLVFLLDPWKTGFLKHFSQKYSIQQIAYLQCFSQFIIHKTSSCVSQTRIPFLPSILHGLQARLVLVNNQSCPIFPRTNLLPVNLENPRNQYKLFSVHAAAQKKQYYYPERESQMQSAVWRVTTPWKAKHFKVPALLPP